MNEQSTIIPRVKELCNVGKYDEAIALTNQIENKAFAVAAHLLCMEHEERRRINALGLVRAAAAMGE